MPSIRELMEQGSTFEVTEEGLLYLAKEDITSLEGLAAIPNIERVKKLELSMNDGLTGRIEGLGQMCPLLEHLSVFNTKISALYLEDCTQLREVRASNNYFLKDITEIKLPASVTVKDFYKTGISEHFARVVPDYYENFVPWGQQPQLQAPVRLTGIAWVNSLPEGLTEIDASNRELTDEAARRLIERFPNLQELYADNNPALTSLDVSGCHNLQELDASHNPALTSLNVSGLQNLQKLYAYNNPALTSLDVSGCHNLQILTAPYNPALTSLDVSGCHNLQELYAYYNPALASLDVSGLQNLQRLGTDNNPALTSLDVSGLQNLEFLNASHNPALTSLNVSGLQNLQKLYAYNNPALTSLDASGLQNLQILDADNNPGLKAEGLSRNILERLASEGPTDDFQFDLSQADASRALNEDRFLGEVNGHTLPSVERDDRGGGTSLER